MLRRSCCVLFHEFKATLVDTQNVSPTTRWLRFDSDELKHDTISSVFARIVTAAGTTASSMYTPITTRADSKYFDILVKKNEEGTVSKVLHALVPGHQVTFEGPFLHARYVPSRRKYIGLVAGGTGVTPFFQLLREGLNNASDTTKFRLLYACASEEEILMKQKLELLVKETGRLEVSYVVEKGSPGWTGPTGYVTMDLLKEFLPPPSNDNLILVCGPAGLTNAVCGDQDAGGEGFLQQLGYQPQQIFRFDAKA